MTDKMTKIVEEVRRELFESIWPMPSNCMRCGNTYAATSYNAWQAAEFINRWEGFNKALDAVEIQLPGLIGLDQPFTGTPISEIRAHNHYNQALDYCRAAIEQTGLGLRVK